MGKNERIRRMKSEGMHEIKNKYRVRAVKKKKKGLVMTAKKRRRALKAGASLSAIFVLILGVFAIGSAFLSSVVPNVVPDDFVTVSYEPPVDGSNPADHSALENIGYMNYRFKNQNRWYAEMHGTTTSMGIAQSVNTIKQYSDGVLIMADVTSGFANAGRQFCYVGDEVMWRELPKSSSYKMDSFEDMQALTFNDELEAHMTIPAFKEKNGLPGTEMSVYIINEDTLDRADPVELVTTGEWDDKDFAEKPVYRQTYYLRPGDSEHLGAAAHYANQMAFTGGLTGLPEFNYITVTYTFDSSWQILRAEINEAYKAQMGITVNCSSDFQTDYEYGTDRAYNSVYESYYKDLVGVGIDDNVEKPLDSTALLISSFLTKPVTFEVELEIDGRKTSGIISLDASKLDLEAIMAGGSPDIAAALGGVGLKAQIGDIFIYLEDSTAYISVHELKAKLPVDKLLTLIGGANAAPEEPEAEETPKVEEPAKTEEAEPQAPVFGIGDPVLSEDGASASVHAEINLTSLGVNLVLPIDFKFALDEEKNASLDSLDLSAQYQGIDAKIVVKSTQKTVADLTDKEDYIDLYPYADAVYRLIAGKKLDIGLGYANADISLAGNIGIDFTNGLTAAGEFSLKVGESSKTVAFSLAGGVAYVNLDGIKLAVPVQDALALIKDFLPQIPTVTEGGAAGGTSQIKNILDKALSAVFDNDLAALFTLSEEDDALSIGLKGTELLKLFGVNFDLGDVRLSIDGASGAVSANACGAEITLKAGQDVFVDTEGYTDMIPYANAVIKLLKNETLTAGVSYRAENVAGKALLVNGSVTLGLSPLAASGEINVAYGTVQTTVGIVYDTDGYLYLTLDSVKMKANVSDAIRLIASLLVPDDANAPADSETKTNLYATLEKVLALDFGELIEISETKEEGNATLHAAIDGSKLLNLFGVNFDLGEVVLTVGADGVTASAAGVNLTLAGGGTVAELTEAEKAAFVDLKPVLDAIPDLLEKKAVSLVGSAVLSADGKDYALFLNQAIVNFADGIEAYIDASLVLSETTVDLLVYINGTKIKLAIGGYGAELAFCDFASIGDAVVALYADVRETVNPVFGKELLPEAKTIGDLLNVLAALLTGGEGNGSGASLGLDGVLSSLSVTNSNEQNGLFALKIMGFTLDIVNDPDGFVAAKLGYGGKGLEVTGNLAVSAYAPASPEASVIPAMPDADYLGKDDFIELLDYLAAALNTVTADGFTASFRAELPAEAADGTQYKNVLTGTAEYGKGGRQAFNVYNGETKKSVVVSPELYLHVGVAYTDNGADGSNLYVDAYIFNYKKSEGDETLDFFVTLSKFAAGETGYNPLRLYASADELMSLLSVAVSALGIDSRILNDYLVSNRLDLQTVADLKALGSSLLETLGIGDIKSLFGKAASASEEGTDSFVRLIDFAQPDENGVSTLTVGWKDGKAAISKRTAQDGKSYLTGFDLEIGDTAVGVALDAQTEINKAQIALDESYFKLEGIAKLLTLVATSVTHPATTADENGNAVYGSELNKLIYMNGQIKLGISSSLLTDCVLTINVDSVAVVFEEDGVAVNVRFSYKAVTVKAVGMVDVVAIVGDSTVNLTGKNGMVYIERRQTSEGATQLDQPKVLYRAMPLSNFLSDLINQVGFLFNMGDTIKDLLAQAVGSGDGSSGSSPLTINDIGDIADLLSCVYTENADGTHEYVLKVDCSKIKVDGITLGNLYVTVDTMINEKGEEVVRNLGIRGDDENAPLLKAVGIITITLNEGTAFTLRNPRGMIDKELQNTYEGTWKHDLVSELSEGMQHRLQELDANEWAGVPFIEGNLATLSYVINTAHGTQVIKTQTIVVSTGAKDGNGNVIDPAGTIYADFSINSYPSLEAFDNVPGFTPQWTKIYTQTDALPADMTVTAAYVANEYRNLTLVSVYEIGGFTKVGEVWEKSFTYLYGSALPAAENEAYRLVGYCDEYGQPVSASEILKDDMRLYAVWEPVEYEIYYIVDGVETRTAAHYGDLLSELLPVPVKNGYEFSHWSLTQGGAAAEAVTGNADFYAVFTPKTYEIVLKSGYALDGFTADGNGGYVKTIDYVYGSETALPVGEFDTVADGVNKAMFLDGFTETEGGEVLTALSGIARNTTLTAVWSEVKHKVRYVANGSAVTTQNYNDADEIRLPAVPEKFGYRGTWKIDGEAIPQGYRVYGDLEIRAEYVAVEYTFKLVSSERTPGYHEEGGVYVETYKYTFGGAPVGLSAPNDALGYFFGGFYTRENGSGKKVESLTSELVESLAYSIADDEIKLYLYWKENTVTVRYYSDKMFACDGKVSLKDDAQNGYYIDVAYRNHYSIEAYAPKIKGYQQLGWWVNDGGSWSQVKDVLSFYERGAVKDADNRVLADVALWAVWIQDIKVTLTGFYTNDYLGGKRYNIKGEVEGGCAVQGKSLEIFTALGMKEEMKAILDVVGAKSTDKYGNLGWGGTLTLKDSEDKPGVKTFESLEKDCFNYAGGWGKGLATYGGAIIVKTFSYGDMRIETYSASFVSLATYSVTYRNAVGGDVTVDNVRVACPFAYVKDGRVYTFEQSIVYADELAAAKNIAAPEAGGSIDEFHTYAWPHTPIDGNTTVSAVAIPNLYDVRFESKTEIEGFCFDEERGIYYMDARVRYGESVTLVHRGEKLTPFTVTADAKKNVFDLSLKVADIAGAIVMPFSAEGYGYGFEIEVQSNPDLVTLSSDVAFIYNGKLVTETSVSFDTKFVLPQADAMIAGGYTFLGWFERQNGGWVQVTELTYCGGGNQRTVEALWMKNFEAEITDASRNKGGWTAAGYKYTYSAQTAVTGANVVGKPVAGEGALSVSYSYGFVYFINDDASPTGQSNKMQTNAYTQYVTADSGSGVYTSYSTKAYMNVEAKVTVTVGGIATAQTVYAYYQY